MTKILIRDALSRDREGVLSLIDQLSDLGISSQNSKGVRNYQYELTLNNRTYHPVVAVVGDEEKVIGYGLFFERYNLNHDGKPIGHIEDIVVDSNYRGKGIGKRIVKALIDTAVNAGVYKVQLQQKGKEEFYKKLGFDISKDCLMEIRF